jgi:ABC-type glycerol-3-phosphate transport system substrate-binding protein
MIQTRFSSGSAPDVVYTGEPPYSLANLASTGKLSALSPTAVRQHLPASLKGYTSYNGKLYGVEAGLTPLGLVYNVQTLQSMGVTPPATFADLLAACKKFASAGKYLLTDGGADGNVATIFLELQNAFVVPADPNFDAELAGHKVKFATSAGWKNATSAFVDMTNAKCFPPDMPTETAAQAAGEVASGQAGMMLGYSGNTAQILALKPNAQLKMITFPGATSNVGVTVADDGEAVVPAGAKNPAAALALLNYLAGPAAELFNKGAGTNSVADLTSANLTGSESTLVPAVKNGLKQISPWLFNPAAMYTDTNKDAIGLFTHQMTPAQMLANLDSDYGS